MKIWFCWLLNGAIKNGLQKMQKVLSKMLYLLKKANIALILQRQAAFAIPVLLPCIEETSFFNSGFAALHRRNRHS